MRPPTTSVITRPTEEIDWAQAIVTMTSAQLKQNRRWHSVMTTIKLKDKAGNTFVPARFSHIYKMTTSKETKNNFTWHGWNIEISKLVDDANLYTDAKAFASLVKKGGLNLGPPASAGQIDEKPREKYDPRQHGTQSRLLVGVDLHARHPWADSVSAPFWLSKGANRVKSDRRVGTRIDSSERRQLSWSDRCKPKNSWNCFQV